MEEENATSRKQSVQQRARKNRFNIKNLRLSLKHRPEIFELILKMRSMIKRKNRLVVKLKQQLKFAENCLHKTTESHNIGTSNKYIRVKEDESNISTLNICIQKKTDACSQTDYTDKSSSGSNYLSIEVESVKSTREFSCQTDDVLIDMPNNKELDTNSEESGWNTNKENGENEKSIAEQVKEVAQNALQQTGMVYVESAGMYYDYKTGYYYNSELGLYYHTDTNCYYYYSEEKQTFVFHSYPDRSADLKSDALLAHERKKERDAKRKIKAKQKEDDLDNLTKCLSKDKEETDEPSKPKRKRESKKNTTAIQASELSENKVHDEEENTNCEQQRILKEDYTKEKNESKTNESDISDDQIDKSDVANIELEDGECSESEAEEPVEDNEGSDCSTSTVSDDESVAKHHPPSMRVIVRETNLPKLKIGSLFLVTKDGGSVGREGDHHSILIKDANVSRHHLDIKYDLDKNIYTVMDVGSKNGTILNGVRICESQVPSKPMEIQHGSTIQLGETKLLCHIHPGNDTCGHCEPGLVMEAEEKEKKVAYTRTCNVQIQHKLELARLKNTYAPKPLMIENEQYNDRAKARREAVGSSHHSEKTQSSDLETHITPENKGFKLMQKMGWSKGEGLGKDNQGDTEPIPLVGNENKAGLGTQALSTPAVGSTVKLVSTSQLRPNMMRLMTKTKMLQPPAKAFQPADEDSE